MNEYSLFENDSHESIEIRYNNNEATINYSNIIENISMKDSNITYICQNENIPKWYDSIDTVICDTNQDKNINEYKMRDEFIEVSKVFIDDTDDTDDLIAQLDEKIEIQAPSRANTLVISPSSDWTNISAAGATRTVIVTTNLPSYNVSLPSWMSLIINNNGFSLTALANTIASARSDVVSVYGGGITNNFNVSQLAASPTLTISPTTDWTNIPVAGATRIVYVSTNLMTYTYSRPGWMDIEMITGGFKLTAPVNNIASERTGIVSISGGGITRSFNVSQLAASPILTISPTTDWINIPASGATRTVTVTSNLPTYTISGPGWINNVEILSNGFKLTVPINTTSSERTNTINVSGNGIIRSFSVSQLAGNPTILNNRVSYDIDLPVGYTMIFKFIPNTTGTYDIFTESYGAVYPVVNLCDTVLEVFTDQNLSNRIYINDDFNSIKFSRVEAQLSGNTPYYIRLKTFNSTNSLKTRIFARNVNGATQTWHWVNSNRVLAWVGNTVYNNELNNAISKWNNYRPSLIQSSNGTEMRITSIIDVNYDDGWAGMAYSTGRIELSTIAMSPLTFNQKINVIAHEFGHILGLAHNEVYDIMWSAAANYTVSWPPSRNDKMALDNMLTIY